MNDIMENGMLPSAIALTSDELHRIDAYWRAANYLSVG
jgi:phosphoketolase